MKLFNRLWISTVVMVTVARIPPSLSSNPQTCEKPISLYSEGKLQRINGEKVAKEHCPVREAHDGQPIQTIPKLIRRSMSIPPCPGRAHTSDVSGIFVCRIPDCLSNPCQNGGSCEETKDSFKCLCPSVFTGVTCETAVDITSNTSTTGKPALTTKSGMTLTTIDIGMEDTTTMSTTDNLSTHEECSHANRTCPPGWDAFGCKCYKYIRDKELWTWHFNKCQDLYAATMLVIESEEEDDFIIRSYGWGLYAIWLGCKRPSGNSSWYCPATGARWSESFSYPNNSYWNWASTEPNEDYRSDSCLLKSFFSVTNNWNDVTCKAHRRSVCEIFN
ncbi:neurogenic locus notch homolog protein 1-like [Strongylocentrotus purpuratus]|uniref:Uncharacterized protein n=1 Tax=Strongylocentrotus purpuratus TaxID=7668 RepID=A0A7M7T057_STRPU|nr:neurogenic locus notch homolog protein 1-like [Strongylocentrotus purpuratus]